MRISNTLDAIAEKLQIAVKLQAETGTSERHARIAAQYIVASAVCLVGSCIWLLDVYRIGPLDLRGLASAHPSRTLLYACWDYLPVYFPCLTLLFTLCACVAVLDGRRGGGRGRKAEPRDAR